MAFVLAVLVNWSCKQMGGVQSCPLLLTLQFQAGRLLSSVEDIELP